MEKYAVNNDVVEHTVWRHRNNGNYELSVVARLQGPRVSNVQYIVRLRDPKDTEIDYMANLGGFKELGELFLALHNFCRLPIYADQKDMEKLKELLTVENIKKFSRIIVNTRL